MKKTLYKIENHDCIINEAYRISAKVVALYGDIYLPIFKRMHEELQKNEVNAAFKSLAIDVAEES